MATKIRLKRVGRRNRPFYRLIIIDSRKKRDGAAIEQVGWFNPIDSENSYEIKDDRILYWLSEGAIPSNAVKKIMKRDGLALRWHLMQQGVDEKEIEKEIKKWELNQESALATREAKAAEKLEEEKAKSKPVESAGDEPKSVADSTDEESAGDGSETTPEVAETAEEESADDTGEEE